MNSEIREDLGYGDKKIPVRKVGLGMRDDDRAVYRVEITNADGSIDIKRVGKEYLRPNMKIIERIK